jgi:hypothetical protein
MRPRPPSHAIAGWVVRRVAACSRKSLPESISENQVFSEAGETAVSCRHATDNKLVADH